MSWKPDYVTVAELKAFLRISDSVDDTELALAISAASRAVDRHTNRQFGQDDVLTERLYAARFDRRRDRWVLDIDDTFDAAPTIQADTANGDEPIDSFIMEPRNSDTNGLPFTRVVVKLDSTSMPHPNQSEEPVGVLSQFGWPTVPAPVKQATLLQASRFFARKDAPFGVAGSPTTGSEMRLLAKVDPDVAVVLGPYVRWWGAVS